MCDRPPNYKEHRPPGRTRPARRTSERSIVPWTGQGARPCSTAPPRGQARAVDGIRPIIQSQRRVRTFFFADGMELMRARRILLTDSAVVKTSETSASSVITSEPHHSSSISCKTISSSFAIIEIAIRDADHPDPKVTQNQMVLVFFIGFSFISKSRPVAR